MVRRKGKGPSRLLPPTERGALGPSGELIPSSDSGPFWASEDSSQIDGLTIYAERSKLTGMICQRSSILALFAAALLSLASCSQEHGPVRDARADAVGSAVQRLQGKWVLTSFQPEVSLDPVMALLLRDQLDHMVVELQGQALTATGPGLTVNRTYRIGEAYLDHFTATIFDAYGVGVN